MGTDNIEYFLTNQFRLSQNEANIYLGLLQRGSSTILEISKYTAINRATVHVNVENLLQMGLVTQTKKGRGKRRQIVAEPPERLQIILEQNKLKMHKAEEELPDMIKQMHLLYPPNTERKIFDVKFYEGEGNMDLLYTEILRSNEIYAYFNTIEMSHTFIKNMNKFVYACNTNKNMHIKEIMNKSEAALEYINKMPQDRYFYKFIPANIKLKSIDYMIYSGNVAVVNIQKEPKATVISNIDYYETSLSLFQFMWDMLE